MRLFAIEPTALRRMTDWDTSKPDLSTESHGVLYARSGSRSEGKVAVLSLQGVMDQKASLEVRYFGGTSTELFGKAFDAAMADESVRAVVLDVDSPGGYVQGTPELAAKVFKARGTKPIIAVANPMAASAALFVASAADEFYVTPTGDVGSLGVRAGHIDVSGFLEQMGVVETMVVAEDSPHKAEFSDLGPMSEEDHERLQAVVDEHMKDFVGAMAAHRGVSVEHVKERFGGGRMLMPKEAKSAGLVDGIATFDEVIGKVSRSVRGRSTKAARLRVNRNRAKSVLTNDSRPV